MGQLVQSLGSSKPGWVPYLPPPQGKQERTLLSPSAIKRSCEPYCLRGDKETTRPPKDHRKTTEKNRKYKSETTNNDPPQHHHHHHHHNPRTPEDNFCTKKHRQCRQYCCICQRHNFYNQILDRGRLGPRICLSHRPRTPRVYLSRVTKNPFHNHGTPLPRTCVPQHRVRTRSQRRHRPCPLCGHPGK